MGRLGYLLRMAMKDLAHEWTVSLAVCLAITSVAAPILVLFGLYTGVVGEIFAGLRDDPAARQIRLQATGAARFRDPWFDEVRAWPEVAFITPATRFSSTQVQAFDPSGTREARTNLLPTGAGDPLFEEGAAPPGGTLEAGISASLADKLKVGAGDAVTLEISRRFNGRAEAAFVDIRVTHKTTAATFDSDALFVSLALLVDIETYKDGAAAPLLEVGGETPKPRDYYPDFRLYARDISDVAPLVARLRDAPHNLSLRAETGRIKFAEDLAASLQLVIGAVGLLGVLGLAGGLSTIQWSMAARRRRIIAVLSLIGFHRGALIGLPVIQALLLGLIGSVLTALTAILFAGLINTFLGDALGPGAARISPLAIAAITSVVLVISVLPALVIGRRLSNLEPANEIRET